MTLKYPKIVAAALAETVSKFKLAEALVEEIPERGSAGNFVVSEKSVPERLDEVRQEVIAAGGEARSVGTLKNYREVALWVLDPDVGVRFRWVEGSSFSAHKTAYETTGISYEDFAANPRTVREMRNISDDDEPTDLEALAGLSEQDVVTFLQYVASNFPDLMIEASEDFSDEQIKGLAMARGYFDEERKTGSAPKPQQTRENVRDRIQLLEDARAVTFARSLSRRLLEAAEEIGWAVNRRWDFSQITASDTNEIAATLDAAEAQIKKAREALGILQNRNNG